MRAFYSRKSIGDYRLDMQGNSDFLEVKEMDELSQKLMKKKNTLFIL
jgi:hypothetical protein